MSYTRLVLMPKEAGAPWPHLTLDAAGMVVTRGALSPQTPAAGAVRTVLIVPGAEVTARWIALKAANDAQGRAAAAMMLEDDLGAPRESLHIAVGQTNADGRRLVCVMAAGWMRAILEDAAALGLTPQVVAPDYLMLPAPDGDALLAADLGETLAVRGRDLAFTAERELVPRLAQGRPMETVDDAARIEGMMAALAAAPPINLLQGDFAPRGEQAAKAGDFRLAAILALAVLISPLLLLGAAIVRDTLAAGRMERAAVETALAATGPVEGDPVAALRVRAQASDSGERFLQSSAAVFDAVAGLQGASLQAFNYQADGAMRLTLVHANFSDAEALGRALEPGGLVVREDAATEADGRITSDITVIVRAMNRAFEPLRARWAAFNPREKIMVALLGVVVVAVVGWYGVIAPLNRLAEDAEIRLAAASAQLAQIEAAAAALAATPAAPVDPGDLEAAVVASAVEAGVPLSRRQALGPTELTLWIDAVPSPSFFAWTRALHEQGVAVVNLTALSAGEGALQIEARVARAAP